jgi:hypothetical protein
MPSRHELYRISMLLYIIFRNFRNSNISLSYKYLHFLRKKKLFPVILIFSSFFLSSFLRRPVDALGKTMRRRRYLRVSGAPSFKYKSKRRSGRLPVGASRLSWNIHARQKAPAPRRSERSSFMRVSKRTRFPNSSRFRSTPSTMARATSCR